MVAARSRILAEGKRGESEASGAIDADVLIKSKRVDGVSAGPRPLLPRLFITPGIYLVVGARRPAMLVSNENL